MPEVYLQIFYSPRAHLNAADIKHYILHYFTQREVNNFLKLLSKFEKNVCVFPLLYRKSSINSQIHRAVLSKQLSVFYIVKNSEIIVIAMMDNRMSETKWP